MASAGVAVKTIVIANSSELVRDRFRAVLESAGHESVFIAGATELLALLKANLAGVDLVVLDMRLPAASGVDLVRAIRKIDGGRLPILIFSGTIAGADEVRALAGLGVAGYLNEHSAAHHILPSLAPHLFPDNFNRRGSPRAGLGIPVEYRSSHSVAVAQTLDLSHGGLGIRTTSPVEPGSKLRVRFRIPGATEDTSAEGCVVWSDPRVGMGLQFEAPTPADRNAIDNFVDTHFFSNRKA